MGNRSARRARRKAQMKALKQRMPMPPPQPNLTADQQEKLEQANLLGMRLEQTKNAWQMAKAFSSAVTEYAQEALHYDPTSELEDWERVPEDARKQEFELFTQYIEAFEGVMDNIVREVEEAVEDPPLVTVPQLSGAGPIPEAN